MATTDAYNYTDQLLRILERCEKVVSVSKEFNQLDDNGDRVQFLESQLLKYDLMPTKNLRSEKCEKIAEAARQEGNRNYKNKKFLKALENYNKALCYSPIDHKMMGVLYANRSAVYFELGHYEKCLDNIDKAIEFNYENMDKIKSREERCKSSLNNTSTIQCMEEAIDPEFLQLSYKPNENVPFIAECLELDGDENFGRYVITNKKLSPGEIIAIDEPFSKCLIKHQNYKYCSNCLSDNCLSLYPCQFCTQVMFCSLECQNEGAQKFHRFECSIIDKLNEICTKIMRIAVHTFFEALDVYPNVLDLMNGMQEIEDSPMTIFDLKKGGKIERSQILATIDSLMTNEDLRSAPDLFQRSGIVAILTHLFLKYTKLNQVLKTEESQKFFRKFVFKQTEIAAINYHGIFDGIMSREELTTAPQYASGSYPFCSLINHSCAPNIVRVSYNCKNYVMVNRQIEIGEQLFDNYGYHHCINSLSERQKSLEKQYMFKCSCEACTKNYPLYPNLPRIAKAEDFDLYLGNDISELTNLNYDTAKKRFESYCKYLGLFPYPSHEASSLQECILQCSFIFKATPFKLKLLTP